MYSENDFRLYRGGELYHHGVKGMKWGIRRYQNPDGSLTREGRMRYGNGLGLGETYKHRRKRAINAADYASKAEKFKQKADRASDKNKFKKEAKLRVKQRFFEDAMKASMSGLTENELRVGERYFRENEAAMRSMVFSMVISGGGLSGAIGGTAGYLGAKTVNALSKEGREIRKLDKQNKEEYENRQKNRGKEITSQDKKQRSDEEIRRLEDKKLEENARSDRINREFDRLVGEDDDWDWEKERRKK